MVACLPFVEVFLSKRHKATYAPPEFVLAAFKSIANGGDRVDAAGLASFMASTQGESSITEEHAGALIAQYHRLKLTSVRDLHSSSLDIQEFVDFLLHPDLNPPIEMSDKPTQDMTAPLSHYFIRASHNSYLTGNQLTSRSSVVPIIRALEAGCRVIELDCWERRGNIVVLHGNTLTRPVSFEVCIKAIKQNAFVASEYPVIITIENHLAPELQKQAAKIMRDIFGDALFIPSPEERPPVRFASPEELKGKIIVSDRPPKDTLHEQDVDDPETVVDVAPDFLSSPPRNDDDSPPLSPTSFGYVARKGLSRQIALAADALTYGLGSASSPKANDMQPRTLELEELIYILCEKPQEMKDAPVAGQLVPGERAVMANVSEPQLRKFVKANAGLLIKYCKNNLGRMYPFGLRFDSSNADPFLAWSHGFQFAALNIQGHDRPCWVNTALFTANGGCGFVKKPDVLLRDGDLIHQEIANMSPKVVLKVRVLMGTNWHKAFDLFKKPDFYVKVALHGVPSDKAKRRTETIFRSNEPHWEHQLYEFPIRVPEMAILRFEVWEDDRLQRDDFVGQACFYVNEMKTGIRSIPLRSRNGNLLQSKLLCWIHIQPYSGPESVEN